MLSRIKILIQESFSEDQPETVRQHGLELSTAVLLVEVANSDMNIDQNELDKIRELMNSQFNLTEEEIEQFMEDAHVQATESTSLYDFTRTINDSCSTLERKNIIGLMWQVAFADGTLDKYEDHIIRKTADLLYVKHSDFIQMKLKAEAACN